MHKGVFSTYFCYHKAFIFYKENSFQQDQSFKILNLSTTSSKYFKCEIKGFLQNFLIVVRMLDPKLTL